jgi:hypothetical protein
MKTDMDIANRLIEDVLCLQHNYEEVYKIYEAAPFGIVKMTLKEKAAELEKELKEKLSYISSLVADGIKHRENNPPPKEAAPKEPDKKIMNVRNRHTQFINNKAKCKVCGDIIESKSLHDYRACSCGEISIDGGIDCPRWSAKNTGNIISLCQEDNT